MKIRVSFRNHCRGAVIHKSDILDREQGGVCSRFFGESAVGVNVREALHDDWGGDGRTEAGTYQETRLARPVDLPAALG